MAPEPTSIKTKQRSVISINGQDAYMSMAPFRESKKEKYIYLFYELPRRKLNIGHRKKREEEEEPKEKERKMRNNLNGTWKTYEDWRQTVSSLHCHKYIYLYSGPPS